MKFILGHQGYVLIGIDSNNKNMDIPNVEKFLDKDYISNTFCLKIYHPISGESIPFYLYNLDWSEYCRICKYVADDKNISLVPVLLNNLHKFEFTNNKILLNDIYSIFFKYHTNDIIKFFNRSKL